MKTLRLKMTVLVIFGVLFCCTWGNAQLGADDYNDDLYLAIADINGGSLCGAGNPDYHPGNASQYKTHVWIDLYKLYNVVYRKKTDFNENLTYWTTFGGFGHPTEANMGFKACIDDNNKANVAKGTFDTGMLKFTNVKIPGTGSSWKTGIWINVFSQCHYQCQKGSWWKFEKNFSSRDKVRQFALAGTSTNVAFAGSTINGTNVVLTSKGEVPCSVGTVYGCDTGEVKE